MTTHDPHPHRGGAVKYGLDYIDVDAAADGWNLAVHFMPIDPVAREASRCPQVTPDNIWIGSTAGEAESLAADSVGYERAHDGVLTVHISAADDEAETRLSRAYFLHLENVPEVDPALAHGKFYLTRDLQTDPKELPQASSEPEAGIPISYLAKDYASFRKQILDHLSLLVPAWRERHAADAGVAVVDVLAYAADYLSYYQDGVATEAYLGTARRRVSLRRHARLLDYAVNDGWNSRVWVQLQVDDEDVPVAKGTQLLTGMEDLSTVIATDFYTDLTGERSFSTFELAHDAVLNRVHNQIAFHAGPDGKVLERGANSAALSGHYPNLKSGDVLIIAELPAVTGNDTLPGQTARYHPVRIIHEPILSRDPGGGGDVTSVSWHSEDALPFAIHLEPETATTQRWIVLGNIVLADSGRTVPPESLPPASEKAAFRPRLNFKFLASAEPIDQHSIRMCSVRSTLVQKSWEVVPAIRLVASDPFGFRTNALVSLERRQTGFSSGHIWLPRRDLLRSNRFAREFVAETEEDGSIYLRFGDGKNGARPIAGTRFVAHYRISDHPTGGAASGVIRHVVSDDGRITRVWNPLPAQNETQPDTPEQVRFNATTAYKIQKRCVTEDDYASAAQSHPGIRNAVCRVRWRASGLIAFIYVQPPGGGVLSTALLEQLREMFERRRVAGHDFEIEPPRFVPIDICLRIVLERGQFTNRVRSALHDRFNSPSAPGVEKFFDPDQFTFGTPLYLSRIVATAMQVPGVRQVEPIRFQRWGMPARGEIEAGVIEIGPLEIVRLDNDPEAPQQGMITFQVERGVA